MRDRDPVVILGPGPAIPPRAASGAGRPGVSVTNGSRQGPRASPHSSDTRGRRHSAHTRLPGPRRATGKTDPPARELSNGCRVADGDQRHWGIGFDTIRSVQPCPRPTPTPRCRRGSPLSPLRSPDDLWPLLDSPLCLDAPHRVAPGGEQPNSGSKRQQMWTGDSSEGEGWRSCCGAF